MSLTLHYHPLASYCWKALVALHETETAFVPNLVDLGNPEQRAALAKLWSLVKFPVLEDTVTGQVTPEATIIIERLGVPLVPQGAELALETRLRDRFFDNYLHNPMQAIVADRIRPADQKDPTGVAQSRATLTLGYAECERLMTGRTWANGADFSMADCAAAPALWYGDRVVPLGDAFPQTRAYLERLVARPSFARVLEEAKPYLHMFPER